MQNIFWLHYLWYLNEGATQLRRQEPSCTSPASGKEVLRTLNVPCTRMLSPKTFNLKVTTRTKEPTDNAWNTDSSRTCCCLKLFLWPRKFRSTRDWVHFYLKTKLLGVWVYSFNTRWWILFSTLTIMWQRGIHLPRAQISTLKNWCQA